MSDKGLAILKEQLFQLMGQVEQQFILLHTALQSRCLQLMNSLALAAEAQATDLQTIVSVVSAVLHMWCVCCVCCMHSWYMCV